MLQHNLYLQDSDSISKSGIFPPLQHNYNNVKYLLCVQWVLSMPGIREKKYAHSSTTTEQFYKHKTLQQVTDLDVSILKKYSSHR